jgi:hypothetical protein
MDDFMYEGEYLSGITYFNTNWDLYVIDDLVDSNYNKFFDVFEMTSSAYIEELDKSNKGDSVSFIQQIAKEAIGSYLLFKADKQNLNSVIRYSKCREILVSNSSIVEYIVAGLKSTSDKNKRILELVRSAQQENDASTSNYLIFDIAKLVQTKVNSFYSTIIHDILANFERYLPLDLISYSELLEPRIRGEMMMKVEQCFKAFMAKDYQLLSSIAPFGQFSSVSLKINELRTAASITVKQIKSLLDKQEDGKNADLKKIVSEQANGQFKMRAGSYVGTRENLVIESEANNLLLASYLFEKYIVQLEQGNIREFAMKIVMQITSLINPSISSKPYKEILNHFILVAELFFDEMLFINQLSLVLDLNQRTSLENAILNNFDSSSELLNSEQLSPLFIIPTFKTKEDVQQSIAYLSALYQTFHSKGADRLDPLVSSGFKVFLCVLRWIEEINDKQVFKAVQEEYLSINRTDGDDKQNKPFFEFTLRFIANLNKSESVKYSLYKQTVSQCTSHFFEVYRTTPSLRLQILSIQSTIVYFDCLEGCEDYLSNLMYLAEMCTAEGSEQFDPIETVNRDTVKNHREDGRWFTALFCERLNWAVIVILEKSGRNDMGGRDFITGIANLFTNECSTSTAAIKVLKINELTQFAAFKRILQNISSRSRERSMNENLILDQFIAEPFRTAEANKTLVPVSLFILRFLLSILPVLPSLRANGFTNTSNILLKWIQLLSKDFVFPFPEVSERLAIVKDNLYREVDPQFTNNIPTFFEQSTIFNLHFNSGIENSTLNFAHRLLGRLACTQNFFQQIAVNKELQNSENLSPLHFLILTVSGLVEILPAGCVYSAANMVNQFRPMINYPEPELKRFLPVVQMYQQGGAGSFTELWQCTQPGCQSLVPIGNCGQIGHAGDRGAVGRCLGCGREVGRVAQGDPGLRVIGIQNVINTVNQLKQSHENTYRPCPLENGRFDESWILDLYNVEIKTKSEAIFIHFIQSIFHLIFTRKSFPSNNPSSRILQQNDNTYEIILNDYNQLISSIGRDGEVVLVLTMTTLNHYFRVATNQADPQYNLVTTPAGMRSLLSTSFRANCSDIPALMSRYNQFKQAQNQNSNTATISEWMSFVRRETSKVAKQPSFLTNSLALMKEYRSPGIDTIQNYLTKHNQDPHCQFVLRLFEKLPILKDLRAILTSIKNLGLDLKNLLDTKLTREQARNNLMMNRLLRGDYNHRLGIGVSSEYHYEFRNSGQSDKLANLTRSAEVFKTMCRSVLANLVSDHNKLLSNSFECQRVDGLSEIILGLQNLESPVLAYVVSDCRDGGNEVAPHEIALQTLITDLTKVQNDILEEFKKISATQSNRGFPSKPVYSASPENFICLNQKEFEEEVKRHSHYLEKKKKDKAEEMGQDDDEEAIAVDVRYLAEKYADELFCHSCILSVEPCVRFLDSDSRSLRKNITTLYSRMKIDDSQANQKKRLPELDRALSIPASYQSLEIALKIILGTIVEKEVTCKPGDNLSKYIDEQIKDLFSSNQALNSFIISDLKWVYIRMLESQFASTVQTQKKFTSKLYGDQIKEAMNKKGDKGQSNDHLETTIILLKAAFSEMFGQTVANDEKDLKNKADFNISDLDEYDQMKPGLNALPKLKTEPKLKDIPAIVEILDQMFSSQDS